MSFRFRVLLLGAAIASTMAQLANAQDASTSGDGSNLDQLTDVVVTAQRREERIQDVPTTVTAITGNYLLATDLGGSAANITFLVADTSAGETAPTRPRWWIRGVGTGAQGFDV